MKLRIFKPIVIAFMLALASLSMSNAQAKDKYNIGDNGPSGVNSKVFYIDGTGKHGLEVKVADYDELGANWEDALTQAASYNSPVCATPQLTPSCWHLPTKTELQLLYEQKNAVGILNVNGYWSSTDTNGGDAWVEYFFDGNQTILNKISYLSVRAVRAF